MKIKMYGISSCHDCIDAEKILKENQIEFEYLDFAKEPLYLKEFLQIRDHNSLFKDVRDGGYIGIPCFVFENGTISLEISDVIG